MKLYKYYFIVLFFIGCSSTSVVENLNKKVDASSIYIEANLEVLSHDLYEGREATTRGEHLSSLFIISELKKYGVKPFEGTNNYLQPFELEKRKISESSIINANNKNYYYGKDFVRFSRGLITFSGSYDLVFAGFGIDADEYNYNDYKDLDVKGKVVLLLPGEPESNDVNFFKGNDITSYSNFNNKLRTARENGAVAVIYIPNEQVYENWEGYTEFFSGFSLRIKSNETQAENNSTPAFTISNEFAKDIFSQGNIFEFTDYKSLKEVKPYSLSKTIDFNIELENETVITNNIIGFVEGNDPELKNEYVFMGAHYDHTGQRGESIFNGADDNGSGTVSLLESARLISQLNNNKRSIAFIFFAAEEKGLLGSRYFTDNFKKLDKISGMINMDMVGREDENEIHVIGSNRLSSELHDIVLSTNDKSEKFNMDFTFNDPNDPNRFYERSDHYNFAKYDIPVVFFFDNMRVDYHRETDTFEKININKIRKVTNLVTNIALDISNRDKKLVVDVK